MKASAQVIESAVTEEKSLAGAIAELVKARLTALVVLTTLAGFYMGSGTPLNVPLMIHAVLGTALLACGAAALNQLLERDLDARMQRTEKRPLPAGRISPDAVLITGTLLSVAGLVYLAFGVNLLTSLLGAITLASYLFVYTPLKRKTTLNTLIGAIPGALPPLMGWSAARGEITIGGWSLFAILFLWQLPHFMAIAWMYREDYARAGFKMLPVVDPDGRRTAAQAVCHSFGLIPVSLCPAVFGLSGVIYFVGALLLGIGFFYTAVQFSRHLTLERARVLFFASIIYLPLLFGLMIIDKVKIF